MSVDITGLQLARELIWNHPAARVEVRMPNGKRHHIEGAQFRVIEGAGSEPPVRVLQIVVGAPKRPQTRFRRVMAALRNAGKGVRRNAAS